MGPVFAIRMQEDTGRRCRQHRARLLDRARDHRHARPVGGHRGARRLGAATSPQYEMMFETTRLLRHLSYWVLRNRRDDLDIERTGLERLQPGIRELMRDLPELIEGTEVERYQQALARYSRDGVPEASPDASPASAQSTQASTSSRSRWRARAEDRPRGARVLRDRCRARARLAARPDRAPRRRGPLAGDGARCTCARSSIPPAAPLRAACSRPLAAKRASALRLARRRAAMRSRT